MVDVDTRNTQMKEGWMIIEVKKYLFSPGSIKQVANNIETIVFISLQTVPLIWKNRERLCSSFFLVRNIILKVTPVNSETNVSLFVNGSFNIINLILKLNSIQGRLPL